MLGATAHASTFLLMFREGRGRNLAERRPLYAYRCTDNEWHGARDVLENAFRSGRLMGTYDNSLGAVFCLYASEWWRRNHAGGAWAWYRIFDAFGAPTPAVTSIHTAVERGLFWWRRNVLTSATGRQFLVTLACEGGLPLQLLRREGNKLRRYFRAVFEEFGLHRDRGAVPLDLASRAAAYLPHSLQRPEVFALGGDLVDAIWSLRGDLPARDCPLDDLDAKRPGWRDTLPLRLDDAVALDLLRGLVADAIEVSQRRRSALRVETTIERVGEEWLLRRRVRCPSQLDSAGLERILGRETGTLPTRFTLFVQVRGGRTLLLAHCTRRAGVTADSYYLLEGYGRGGLDLPEETVLSELFLYATSPDATATRPPGSLRSSATAMPPRRTLRTTSRSR